MPGIPGHPVPTHTLAQSVKHQAGVGYVMEEYLVLTARGMIQKQTHVLAVREVLGFHMLVIIFMI